MSDERMWPTPAVNDMGANKTPAEWDAWTAAMKARHGNGNGHGPSLSIEAQRTPSSTSLPVTAASPSPSRLWPTPQAHDAQGPKTPEQIATMRAKGYGVKNLNEEVHSAPSASRRSSPMPVPCSPTDSLGCPTSAPFSQSPEIACYANAVRSRLSLLAAFHASPTATPGSDSPGPMSATSGPNACESFGNFDPALPSLRMLPDSSVPSPLPRMVHSAKDFFSTEFCQTWPKSGLLVNGTLYRLPPLAPPTKGCGPGSSVLTSDWPTAQARDTKGAYKPESVIRQDGKSRAMDNLPQAVITAADWPTPTAAEGVKIGSQANYGQMGLSNHPVIVGPPTRPKGEKSRAGPPPTASGPPDPAKRSTSGSPQGSWLTPKVPSGGGQAERRTDGGGLRKLEDQTEARQGGKLNPAWVETLMGLPLGHTQLPRKFVKPKKGKQ